MKKQRKEILRVAQEWTTALLIEDNLLKKRIDKWCYGRSTNQYEQAKKKQDNNDRQEPPFLIVSEEVPEVREHGGPLLWGNIPGFHGLLLSMTVRH